MARHQLHGPNRATPPQPARHSHTCASSLPRSVTTAPGAPTASRNSARALAYELVLASSLGTHLWFTQKMRVFDQSIARPCRPASALSTLHSKGGGCRGQREGVLLGAQHARLPLLRARWQECFGRCATPAHSPSICPRQQVGFISKHQPKCYGGCSASSTPHISSRTTHLPPGMASVNTPRSAIARWAAASTAAHR